MKQWFIIVCCLLAFASQAQIADTGFALVRTYKGDISGAALDNLDNLYIISSTGQVKKFGAKGDSVGVFNGIRAYGKLSTLDVSNPLTPLLFYKDFASVVVLDRFLTRRVTVDLRRSGILQPSAVGLSYDNNFWVFDALDNKLRKVDEAGTVLRETDDFRVLFGQSINPQRIVNDDRLVYVADSAAGIFVFDHFGTFKRRILLKGWNAVDVYKNRVVRLSDGALIVYDPQTFLERRMAYPATFKPYAHSFTTTNKVITFSEEVLQIYRVGY